MSQQEATFCRPHCGLWASRRRIPREATRLREALRREGYTREPVTPCWRRKASSTKGRIPGADWGAPGAARSDGVRVVPLHSAVGGSRRFVASRRSFANRESHSEVEKSSPLPPCLCYGKTKGWSG
jgi:hypothetical protein